MTAVKPLGIAEVAATKAEQRAGRHLLGLVIDGKREGLVLRTQFLLAAKMAIRPTASPHMREMCAKQAAQLLRWAEKNLKGDARKAVKEEVMMFWKPIFYSRMTLQKEVPELAQLMLPRNEVARLQLDGHVRKHLSTLLGSSTGSSALATQAWKALDAQLGGNEALWQQFLDILVHYSDNLAQQSRDMAKDLQKIDQLTGEARRAAMRQFNSTHGGLRWTVRGKLGELMLATWPKWKREIRHRLMHARGVAETIPPAGKWVAEYHSGRLGLGGKETWDEAILLVNHDTGQAILHTSAQIKITTRPRTTVKQTLRDPGREAGFTRDKKGATPTVDKLPSALTLFRDGKPVTYSLERHADVPPPVRYLFFPKGIEASEEHLLRLEARHMETRAYQLDVDVDTTDALALHLMKGVEQFSDALKTAKTPAAH